MTLIDLNEICKIIYYKYILPFKVLDIIGVKHSQDQGFRVIFCDKLSFFLIFSQKSIYSKISYVSMLV